MSLWMGLTKRHGVIRDKEHSQEALNIGIRIDDLGYIIDEPNYQLCHVICRFRRSQRNEGICRSVKLTSWSRFATEEDDARNNIFPILLRQALDREVAMNDAKYIHALALILMNSLDLDVEQGRGVQLDAHGLFDEVCKSFFVLQLDVGPLFLEGGVISMGEKTFKLLQVFQPHGLVAAESLRDKSRESGVALVKPAARRDTVGDVPEPMDGKELQRQVRRATLTCLGRGIRRNP